MTLSEIVEGLKEGERFQADWQKENGKGCYCFFKDNKLFIHSYESEWEETDILFRLKDNYEFLPPEPKFKVGERVRRKLSKGAGKITEAEYDRRDKAWLYTWGDEWGWHLEHNLELAPDICPECGYEKINICKRCGQSITIPCGQEMGEKKEVSFNVGDFVETKTSSAILEITSKEWVPECEAWKYWIKGNKKVAWYWHKSIELHEEPEIEWDGGDLPKWKALFLTWKMWDWLAKNPGKGKGDWPEWKWNGGRVGKAFHDCMICSYVKKMDGTGYLSGKCPELCPLVSLWRGNCQKAPESPFRYWEKGYGSKSQEHHAQTIADFAKGEYFKEIAREKNSA